MGKKSTSFFLVSGGKVRWLDNESVDGSEDEAGCNPNKKPEEDPKGRASPEPEGPVPSLTTKRRRKRPLRMPPRNHNVGNAGGAGPGPERIVIDDDPVSPPVAMCKVEVVSSATSEEEGELPELPTLDCNAQCIPEVTLPFKQETRVKTEGASVGPGREGYSDVVNIEVQIIPDTKFGRDELRCQVCLDRYANVVTIPCGHIVMCELCALHTEMLDILNQPEQRKRCCMSCRSEITSRSLVVLPYNNNELVGYKEAVKRAKCAVELARNGDASMVRFLYPDYPIAETIDEVISIMHQNDLADMWREITQLVRLEEIRYNEMIAELSSDKSDNEDPTYVDEYGNKYL